MFQRENRKCFRETENCFGVNHQAGKVLERVQNFLEGAGNVLGPSGIFPERTRVKNTMFPQGGQDPPFRGSCFWVGPPLGGSPQLVEACWGAPMVGGKPPQMVETMLGGGPLGGPLHGAPGQRGAPLWGKLPPFGGPDVWEAILPLFRQPSSCLPHPSSTINRGGEVLSISSQVLTQMACNDLPLSLSLHKIVS